MKHTRETGYFIFGKQLRTLMLIISCWDKEVKLWRILKKDAYQVPLYRLKV